MNFLRRNELTINELWGPIFKKMPIFGILGIDTSQNQFKPSFRKRKLHSTQNP